MKEVFISLAALCYVTFADAAKVKFDYSVIFVPEEGGVKFEKITEDADRVSDYCGDTNRHGKNGNIVGSAAGIFGSRKTTVLDWRILPQIALSPDACGPQVQGLDHIQPPDRVLHAQQCGGKPVRHDAENLDEIVILCK